MPAPTVYRTDEPCAAGRPCSIDCANNEIIAETDCASVDCGEPIGYGQRYVYGPSQLDLFHEDCWRAGIQSTPQTEAAR